MSLQKSIYRKLKTFRMKFIRNLLDSGSKTLLDVGAQDLKFYDLVKEKYDVTLVDIDPKIKMINKADVQDLSFEDKSFDIIVCQEVLEHVPDPIRAMKELKRVAKKQLVISVPNEPFFTLFRFFNWEKEHLWAITPKALEIHLGKPNKEAKFFFKRYYIASWQF